MTQDSDDQLEHAALHHALLALEQQIDAVRRGTLTSTVEVGYDADHPIGALAQAVNDMILALRTAEEARMAQEREIEHRLVTIREQHAAICELSSPVIEVWQGVLTLPIVGALDAERAIGVTTSLLETVVRKRAWLVIIDLTGMRAVGPDVCNHIIHMAKSVRLLGANCGVSGVRPEVARTIVELGSEFGEVRSHPTLRAALQEYVGERTRAERDGITKRTFVRVEGRKENGG